MVDFHACYNSTIVEIWGGGHSFLRPPQPDALCPLELSGSLVNGLKWIENTEIFLSNINLIIKIFKCLELNMLGTEHNKQILYNKNLLLNFYNLNWGSNLVIIFT